MVPEDITERDLYPAARNQLKTLQADVQERVARHLAVAHLLLDEDPELAHQHAISASRRAGRIPVAREFLAMTAYRTGDYALALRELRTYRRLSGRDGHLALMVECERALGRPERALETGHAVDSSKLDTAERVHLAIAMSGARFDLGQSTQALLELEIPELNPNRAYSWSPELFAAYAGALEEVGRAADAATWAARAEQAAAALDAEFGAHDEVEVLEIIEVEPPAETPETSAETVAEVEEPAATEEPVEAEEPAEPTNVHSAETTEAEETQD
ncbi:MAG: hypothetical protein WDA07_10740 [Leucobacter sp.]